MRHTNFLKFFYIIIIDISHETRDSFLGQGADSTADYQYKIFRRPSKEIDDMRMMHEIVVAVIAGSIVTIFAHYIA